MSIRVAQPQKARIVPAFVVEEVKEEVTRTLISHSEKGGFTKREVKEPYGYHVSFPAKGHSIRVRNASELKRLGYDRTIPLVDANSDNDDVIGELPNNVKV